jgi:hypothetical protein
MKKTLALALLCLTILPARSATPPSSGNDHITACEAVNTKSDADPLGQGYCMGAVSMALAATKIMPGAAHACPPEGVTTFQGVRVLVNYMHNHPERLNEPFLRLVVDAFVLAWPCKS